MSEFIETNGARIATRLDGPEGAPVVMFSNSLMCNYGMWQAQVEALGERFRILRYDTRGQGNSQVTPGPYPIDLLAVDAYGVMQAFGISRVHFVGISFGGLIGQRLAVKYPDAIDSLSLCDTGSRFPPREVWDERISIASAEGMAELAEKVLHRWFSDAFIATSTKVVEQVRAMILATPVDGFCTCCETLRDTDLTDSLAEIRAPTLVLHGDYDLLSELSRPLFESIPGARHVVIDDAGHLPNLEQTDAFNRVIAEHLEQQL